MLYTIDVASRAAYAGEYLTSSLILRDHQNLIDFQRSTFLEPGV